MVIPKRGIVLSEAVRVLFPKLVCMVIHWVAYPVDAADGYGTVYALATVKTRRYTNWQI